MNRKLAMPLLIGAGVLVAALVLVFLLGKKSPTPTVAPAAVAPSTVAVPVTANPAPVVPAGATQNVAAVTAPKVIAADDPRRTVERDGMVIHDHRDNPTAATDPTPVINTPGGRLLAPAVANQLSAVVRAGVLACAAAVPASAKGKDPQVSAQVQVSIKAGRMSVISVAEPAVQDVEKAATADLNKCLTTTLSTATAEVTGEADIASYPITLQFAVPQQP